MNPFAIACFVASIGLFCVAFFSTYRYFRRSNLTYNAAKEYQLIIENIPLIETMAEYDFWHHEAVTFITSHRGKVSPRLMIMYEVMFHTAFRLRKEKGFTKQMQ